MTTDVSIHAVGDLHPYRDDPESLLALVAPTLKQADIRFGQLEENLSDRGSIQVQKIPAPLPPRADGIRALTSAGFDVISFASNHSLNWGVAAFLDTLDLLGQKGIAVVGAGKNIDEARKPVIMERKGTRVAFLAYCSVVLPGYEAKANKPGFAPVRVTTFYEQVDWQPGTPPRTVTFASNEDLEAMKEDIRKARSLADVVVMSIHWGIHYNPGQIAMYQKEVGHAAIDAGVDLILGHHSHDLQGIEVYKDKVIFYSLGNFAFDFPATERNKGSQKATVTDRYGWEVDPEYPTYAFPPYTRMTMIARCLISDRKIARISFLPAMVNKQGQPEVLRASDKRTADVLEQVEFGCKTQKFNTKLTWQGDEVVIGT